MKEQTRLKIAQEAKAASRMLATLSSAVKNELLLKMAQALIDHTEQLIESNEKDLTAAREAGLAPAMVDRLALDSQRIRSMADGLREVADLPDPVGEITGMWRRPNDLQIGRMRIPLGVIGIVYESRPNVTADAAGLCLKSGNAVIIHSNLAIGRILKSELERMRLPAAALQVIETTDRSAVLELLKLEEEIDLIIPRGGEGLIRFVSENSRIPVIKHYKGVCHTFVDTPRCNVQASATPWRHSLSIRTSPKPSFLTSLRPCAPMASNCVAAKQPENLLRKHNLQPKRIGTPSTST
jgi:glutamate-5-semialdehyde dehydrogenase